MYNYVYTYEARLELFGGVGVNLPDALLGAITAMSIVMGIIALALLVFTAIAIKRGRVFGIIAAICQPVAFLAGAKVLTNYASLPLDQLDGLVAYSSVSTSDAISKLMEMVKEIFVRDIAPKCAGVFVWAVVLFVASVLTFVYYILLIKEKGKGLSITALILAVLRTFFVSPIELMTAGLSLLGLGALISAFGGALQTVWLAVFFGMMLLPVLLVAIQGLIVLVNNAKAKKAVEAPAEEPAE